MLVAVAGGVLLSGCAGLASSCRHLTGVVPRLVGGNERISVAEYDYADDAARIRHLQCLARQGTQNAQLELARRYEEGDGVARDSVRAAALYARAAATVPEAAAIYMPPATPGGSGRVLRIDNPGKKTGLPEASFRLGRMLLEGRGVSPDASRGRALIEDAAREGHVEAQQWLKSAMLPEESDEERR